MIDFAVSVGHTARRYGATAADVGPCSVGSNGAGREDRNPPGGCRHRVFEEEQMTVTLCDGCGENIAEKSNGGNSRWMIGMRFFSFWNPNGDEVVLHLCGSCGCNAANRLGFQYDTGKILSLSRGDMIDGVEIHGPHGGGLADIAMNGVGGAHGLRWHSQRPKALLAPCLDRSKNKRDCHDCSVRLPA